MADPTLEEIRARWAAMTRLPWRALAEEDPERSYIGHVHLTLESDIGDGFPPSDEDLEAVRNAPTDVAWLLKQAEELAAIKERAWSRIAANTKRLSELREQLLIHPSYAINVEEGRLFAEHNLLCKIVGGLEEECAAARVEVVGLTDLAATEEGADG